MHVEWSLGVVVFVAARSSKWGDGLLYSSVISFCVVSYYSMALLVSILNEIGFIQTALCVKPCTMVSALDPSSEVCSCGVVSFWIGDCCLVQIPQIISCILRFGKFRSASCVSDSTLVRWGQINSLPRKPNVV
jgi:hypothetical protein